MRYVARGVNCLMWALILFALIGMSIATSTIAKQKGRDPFGWFLIGIVFGPIGLMAAIIAPECKAGIDKISLKNGSSKRCPQCAEIIRSKAKICRYCGSNVADGLRNAIEQVRPELTEDLFKAARGGDLERVKAIIDAGADPLIKDESGYTPADYARGRGHST